MKKILHIIFVLDLLIINLALGFIFYQKYFIYQTKYLTESLSGETAQKQANETDASLSCNPNCLSYIDEKIEKIDLESVTQNSKTIIPTTKPTSIPIKTKSVSYIPIPGSGSTLATIWTDLPGTDFYLSKNDYPGLTGVYFEANIKLQNGNGKAMVRIYDVTNNRGVDRSDVEMSNQSSTFVSNGPLSLWEGYNHYRIQAKSLTADTTYFESGRLKMMSEN